MKKLDSIKFAIIKENSTKSLIWNLISTFLKVTGTIIPFKLREQWSINIIQIGKKELKE